MAAVSLPGYPYVVPPAPPEPPEPAKRWRRWWLIGIVTAWGVALTVLAIWSVRHDPPTVADQRDIAAALPILERAAGAMLVAADGPDRAVVLGDLHLVQGCRITPLRSGVEGSRDVTVYVPADGARKALDAIAAALPAGYRAETAGNDSSARIGLHADAGGFVAIDADSRANAQVLTLEASTGCRPAVSSGNQVLAKKTSGDLPATLTAVLRALGAAPGADAVVREIGCPGGRTYEVDGLPAPPDLGRSLRDVVAGATVVRAESRGWAYRTGPDSVVVAAAPDGRLRASVTTACR